MVVGAFYCASTICASRHAGFVDRQVFFDRRYIKRQTIGCAPRQADRNSRRARKNRNATRIAAAL